MSSTDSSNGASTASPTVTSLSFSSSFTPTSSSSSSAADSDNTGGVDSSPGLASSASLYLYTFLATLILLLGVSAAIVIRSLILRRRHRALVEEAIRNGTWVPPPTRPRVDLSKKPKLHEAFLDSHSIQHQRQSGRAEEWLSWDGIFPFSATYITANYPTPPRPIGVPTEVSPPPPARRWWWPWSRGRSSDSATGVQTELAERTPSQPAEPTRVRVGVIVAMPAPHEAKTNGGAAAGEEPLPPLEMGITDVYLRGGPIRMEGDDAGSKLGRTSGSSSDR
ncbi:hypothetical protein HDZ31DRAFT_63005 [Schizophyllum fasciatum]